METDKALYEKYQHEIPKYATFKAIKSKKLKSLLFTGWITEFGTKVIREKMGIPYSTYGYLVKTFGPAAKVDDEIKEDKPDEVEIIVEEKEQPEEAEKESYKYPDPKPDPAPINNTETYTMAFVAPSNEQTGAPQAAKSAVISVEWTNTPESIKSQLEALANFLFFEKGEITVKLEVFNDK